MAHLIKPREQHDVLLARLFPENFMTPQSPSTLSDRQLTDNKKHTTHVHARNGHTHAVIPGHTSSYHPSMHAMHAVRPQILSMYAQPYNGRKTLVLDLDETLVHSMHNHPISGYDMLLKVRCAIYFCLMSIG